MSGRSMRRLVYVWFVVNFALAALLLAWWLPDLWSPDGSLVYRFGWVLLMTGLLAGLTFSIGQVTGWIADVTGMTDKAYEEDREREAADTVESWRSSTQAGNRAAEEDAGRDERRDRNEIRRRGPSEMGERQV